MAKMKSNYRMRFLKEPGIKAKTGKLVYVSPEHHKRIQQIIQVIGKNDTSIYGFVYNVLAEHFASHKDEITELYRRNYESVF